MREKIPYIFPILAGANNTPIYFQYLQGWPSPPSNTFHPPSNTFHTFRGVLPSNPRKTQKKSQNHSKSLKFAKKNRQKSPKNVQNGLKTARLGSFHPILLRCRFLWPPILPIYFQYLLAKPPILQYNTCTDAKQSFPGSLHQEKSSQ